MTERNRKNFYKYTANLVWETATNSWVQNLFTDEKIKKLAKRKNGNKIFNFCQRLRFLFTRKPIIPVLEYAVTTRCTLNCKLCNTYIPYFKKSGHSKITTFDEFKKDLDKLLKAVDYIYCFGLYGGEPLLAKELDKMLKYALSKKQIKHVFIATNCTILPSQELLDAMKNKKFVIRTSNYSNVTNIKGGVTVKYEEFKKLIKENNITLSDPQSNGNTWISPPKLFVDSQNSNLLTKKYSECWGKFCNTLCNGQILPCAPAIYINNNMNLSDEIKEEMVDIRTEKSTRKITKKLISFYSQPYSNYCHYCHTENTEYNLPCGEQLI